MEFQRREAPFLASQVGVSSLMLQVLAAMVPAIPSLYPSVTKFQL